MNLNDVRSVLRIVFNLVPRLKMRGAVHPQSPYEGVSKSFRTGRLKREL
jgi:hypothetical protein